MGEANRGPRIMSTAGDRLDHTGITVDTVDRTLREWAGSTAAARALAAFIADAVKAVPARDEHEHWTLNFHPGCLRLCMGMPEVLTVYSGWLSVLRLASDLGPEDHRVLARVGAEIVPSPYPSARAIASAALRIQGVPIRRLNEVAGILGRGLTTYLGLDRRTGRTPHRRAFTPAVLAYLHMCGLL